MEWPFQFWDAEANCTIKTKFKKFNKIGVEVFVIPMTNVPLDHGQNENGLVLLGQVVLQPLKNLSWVATWTYPRSKFHQHYL